MLQWYLTRYARLLDGEVELLTYAPMSFEDAQYESRKKLPNNEFYEVECKIGSLLHSKPKSCWVARDRYSHKPYVAKAQAEAEVKAQNLLTKISKDIELDLKSILGEMQILKAFLTKPQYEILLNTLMAKPQVMKILYEVDNK